MSRSSPQPANRRTSARRKPRGGRIRCLADDWRMGPDIAVTLLDLSQGGARLLVKSALTRGQEVELELSAVGAPRPLKLPATVAWSVSLADGQHCIGLRFQRYLPYLEVERLS